MRGNGFVNKARYDNDRTPHCLTDETTGMTRTTNDHIAKQQRTGDIAKIPGSYQYDAVTKGNPVQRFWHANKRVIIERYLAPQPTDFILDVGCGSGVISDFLAASGATVWGVDGSRDAITFASETFRKENLSFHQGLVDELFQTDRPVDKLYCLEVLEHIYVDQGHQMLSNFHRTLRPGGAVFLTTPNYHSLWPVIEWTLDTLKLVPQLIDDQHVAKYHRRKLSDLATASGFIVEQLATTCFVAPWLAPLSWRLADKVNAIETGSVFPGSILVAVLRKPTAETA